MTRRSDQLCVTRKVSVEESNWLDRSVEPGEVVFRYTGVTYGCITESGVAVSRGFNQPPFFELPMDAVTDC